MVFQNLMKDFVPSGIEGNQAHNLARCCQLDVVAILVALLEIALWSP